MLLSLEQTTLTITETNNIILLVFHVMPIVLLPCYCSGQTSEQPMLLSLEQTTLTITETNNIIIMVTALV
jgi:hypothetical protein